MIYIPVYVGITLVSGGVFCFIRVPVVLALVWPATWAIIVWNAWSKFLSQ